MGIDPAIVFDQSGKWRPIERKSVTNQAAGTLLTKTWSANQFRQVRLVLRQISHATTGGISAITGIGLTGTYRAVEIFDASAVPAAFNTAAWSVGMNNNDGAGIFTFDFPPAPALKSYFGELTYFASATQRGVSWKGSNDDATHDVTGLGIVSITDTCTYSYELDGVPA